MIIIYKLEMYGELMPVVLALKTYVVRPTCVISSRTHPRRSLIRLLLDTKPPSITIPLYKKFTVEDVDGQG